MRSLFNFFKGKETGKGYLSNLSEVSDLEDKKVLLRASLNVPIKNNKVVDRFRIDRALPTIKHLQEHNAKVIIIAHIGRELDESLLPVYEILREEVGAKWSKLSEAKEAVGQLKSGEVLLLENLRQDPREKRNDVDFAKELSSLADIYVNDAFSASHRSHASIVGVPNYLDSYFGLNFVREYEALQGALTPQSPSVFILGGAKFETKLPLVVKLATKYDQVFIGGALVNDILKAKGYEIGRSLTSGIDLSNSPLLKYDNLLLPSDVVVEGGERKVSLVTDIKPEETIVDIGPESMKRLGEQVVSAKTVLWNGPLGNYEKNYSDATEELAKIIAASGAKSVVGGGDTVTAIHKLDLNSQFDFVSTAGGAMLDFLEKGTLPAITAIQKN